MAGDTESHRIYWDSCVFLHIIEGTEDRKDLLASIIEDCDHGAIEIYTSILSIAEVVFAQWEKKRRVLDEQVIKRMDVLWFPPSKIRLIEAEQYIMLEARAILRSVVESGRACPQGPDGIHLATAKRRGVKEFHTYDGKLLGLKDTLGFKICEPRIDKLILTGRHNESVTEGIQPVPELGSAPPESSPQGNRSGGAEAQGEASQAPQG